MKDCRDKTAYKTRAEAEKNLASLIEQYKRDGIPARHWKRLVVYPHPPCPYFHIGHLRQLYAPKPKRTKAPNRGDMIRKLRRLAEQWQKRDDYQQTKRMAELAQIVAADREWIRRYELEQESLKDYADSLCLARRLADQFFPR
jgi:hypothetical protein